MKLNLQFNPCENFLQANKTNLNKMARKRVKNGRRIFYNAMLILLLFNNSSLITICKRVEIHPTIWKVHHENLRCLLFYVCLLYGANKIKR
mmetsp:Transcript_9590/g.12529  ORF Transcript_9590/g.12529 Transcript_9590/m.12529 type:complete len:91 (+) Transcript_9590:877-1149(+)